MAATRCRTTAYFDALAAAGIDAELRPFVDDTYLDTLYRPGRSLTKATRLFGFTAQRLRLAARLPAYDGIFVQREAMMIGPPVIEWLSARAFSLPVIFDFDDAIWLPQVGSRNPVAARLLKSPAKTETILSLAHTVIAGTEYLADHARRVARNVLVLPTVVSADHWRPLEGRLDGHLAPPRGCPMIGWVGTHSTAAHLDLVVPALRTLADEGHRFSVRLVGAERSLPLKGVHVETVPWVGAREREDFQRIDIGIAPVVDDAWSRGKCGFKQVQYMTVGVPFVTSPVGGATEFVVDGENGLIARSTAEWVVALRRLLEDQALRAKLSLAGRTLVEQRLSVEAQAPRFVDAVRRALGA